MQQEQQEQRSDNLALDVRDVRISPWTWRTWHRPRWRPGTWRRARTAASSRWLLVVFAVALLVVLAGSIAGSVLALRAPAATYQRVRLGNLAVTASGTGPVEGAMYDVSFPAPGRIAEIDAQVGQHVNKGQVLARLDTAALQDAVNQAQAQVDANTTTLDTALSAYSRTVAASQAVADAAQAQEQNALYTCQHEAAPPPDCQAQARSQYAATIAQSRANEATASAQVAVARANLTQAQGQLHTAQAALNGATLTAPASGIVGAINGTVGGSPSTATGPSGMGPFMEIVDMSTVRLVTDVDAASVGRVAVGNPVAFTVDTYGKRVFHGTVSAVSPLGQVSARAVTYPVTIQVDPASLGNVSLLPGLNAHITITTAQRYGVVLVPAAALAFAHANKNRFGAPLVSRAQIASALAQARQMVAQVSAAENASGAGAPSVAPTPAYILEQTRGGWAARPIVLGLTNGASYEVLAGLRTGEVVAMTAR
jgi:HlyD family secretion protein